MLRIRLLLCAGLGVAMIVSACQSTAPATAPTEAAEVPATPTALPPTPSPTPESTPIFDPTATPKPTALPVPTLSPDADSVEEWASLFATPADFPLDVQEVGSSQAGDVTIRDLTFRSPYEDVIPAYLIVPPGDGLHPAVLYVHWYDTHPNAKSNREQFLEEATALAEEGVASLLVDTLIALPGPRQHWRGRSAEDDRELVIRQVVELRLALDVLIAEGQADPERIAYVGHDFGGMFGIVMGAVDGRPRTYVIMASVPDFADWFLLGSTLNGPERAEYRAGMGPVAPLAYVGHLAPASILLQFARSDSFVSEEQANTLFEAASDPRQVEWYTGDHNIHENDSATSDRLDWLRQELGLAGP